jgi:hypothetical protein
MWDFFFNKPRNSEPAAPLPVQPLTRAQLEVAPERSLYRIGHSTLLMKLRGGWWITDPVFAERASPLAFFGPKRFHAPPIALAELPPLRGVLLSHDHYDHLDRATVRFWRPKPICSSALWAWGTGWWLGRAGRQGAAVRLVAGHAGGRLRFTATRPSIFGSQPARRQPHAVGLLGDRRPGKHAAAAHLLQRRWRLL